LTPHFSSPSAAPGLYVCIYEHVAAPCGSSHAFAPPTTAAAAESQTGCQVNEVNGGDNVFVRYVSVCVCAAAGHGS